MCGIAGYIGKSDLDPKRIERCLALMGRRGPDAADFVRLQHQGQFIFLLHSRLSIIDLDDRSRQPFRTDRSLLTFNGELYNYRELKDKLNSKGHNFKTRSDTEVLAKVLDAYAVDGLDQCEGMWAFARYDLEAGTLTLSRDRFGEKPLYYVETVDGIYFASEPKFIFVLLGRILPINHQQLHRYLVNGYKSLYKKQDTFFLGLNEVRPGVCLTCSRGGVHDETRYWHAKWQDADDEMSYEEAVSGARERLIRSVELRLRADVPIGFCLSGGIDSNALIAIAKKHLGYDVHGFTLMNTDKRYEERDLVELSVKDLGLKHTSIQVDNEDFLTRLRELICYHDAPVYTLTYYTQWAVLAEIKKAGYKISISGSAADELFSGYYDHHNAYLATMKAANDLGYPEALANWKEYVQPIVRNPYLSDPDYFVNRPQARDHIYLDSDVFSDFLIPEFTEEFEEQKYSQNLLRNRMANELYHESVPVLLHEDDRNAMYHSIENRAPYLDRDLFEFTQRIPTRHLVQKGRAKSVLRDAVRGIAPDAVLDNPRKIGFNAPITGYVDFDNKNTVNALLEDSPIFDVVHRDKIVALLTPEEKTNSRSKFIFNFLCTKLFLEEFAS